MISLFDEKIHESNFKILPHFVLNYFIVVLPAIQRGVRMRLTGAMLKEASLRPDR